MEKLRERVQQLKKKRPGYGEILDFYQKVKEAQDEVKVSLKIDPIKLKKEWKELLAKEGFSLIQKEDFPVDIEVSIKLFQSLCQIGKTSNPHMAIQVEKINETIDNKKIDLKKLLKMGVNEKIIEQVAADFGLDKKVFSFLVQSSTKLSIEAGMEQLCSELDPETWLKGHCPVCGSLPFLSLLKEEGGKRYLLAPIAAINGESIDCSAHSATTESKNLCSIFVAKGRRPTVLISATNAANILRPSITETLKSQIQF